MKKYQSFLCENFQFLEVEFSIYLYRRVFVMYTLKHQEIVILGSKFSFWVNLFSDREWFTQEITKVAYFVIIITKTRLFKYTENFTTKK